jgi:hypothetical protein
MNIAGINRNLLKTHDRPLIVEINGLGGLIIIRNGSPDQEAGTSIEIIGRKKPSFFDEYEGRIQL